MLLGKQEKIVEARECFAKCCEGRAATLGRDHEDTLGIQKVFTNFVLKHDVFKMVYADFESQDSVSIDLFKRTLQACIIAAVVGTVVDSDAMVHLVRLLLSPTPSVGTDCAACIGLLGTQPKAAAAIALLLDDAHGRSASGDGLLFAALVSILKPNAESRLVAGVLQVLQRVAEAGQKRCDAQGKNPCLASLERLGLFDAVIGL